jgi:hypothetical protein
MNRRGALKALVAMPAVASVARVAVTPSDVIVFECDHHLSMSEVQSISDSAAKIWPNQRIMVLDAGIRMRIAASGHEPT